MMKNSELKITYNERELSDKTIDRQLDVFVDGRSVTSAWVGEPYSLWKDAKQLISAYVQGWLDHRGNDEKGTDSLG